jgi:glyoxylase-like metal-dependent hydrolase (beta-lactamase superfamily II)
MQLTLFARVFPVNCYLVEHGGGLVLVDTGLPWSAPGIVKATRRLGMPLSHIVLTHAHYDHAGALDRIAQEFPQAQVACSEHEAAMLAGGATGRAGEESQRDVDPPGRWIHTVTTPDVILKGGERVGPLRAIPAIGHTPGHMSYLDEATGTLFAGDAFQTRGGLAVAGDPRLAFPWVARATWNPALALESARRLADLPIRRLATAHGETLADPGPRLRQALDRAAQTLEGARR